MTVTDLLVIDRGGDDRHIEISKGDQPRAVGVFTSAQSLVAFPLATSIVATVARASRTIGHTEFDSITVPLAGAFIVGGTLFLLTAGDPRSRPRTWRGWIAMAGTAVVNSLVLFVAALGVEKF